TPRMRGSKLRLVTQHDGDRAYAKGDAPSIDLDDAWLVLLRQRLEHEVTTAGHLFFAVLTDRERRGTGLAEVLRSVPGAREEVFAVLERRLGTAAPWVLAGWLEDRTREMAAMALLGEAARSTLTQPNSAGFGYLMPVLRTHVRYVDKHPLQSLLSGSEVDFAKVVLELGYLVPMFWPRLEERQHESLRASLLEAAEQLCVEERIRQLAIDSHRLPLVLTERLRVYVAAVDKLVAEREPTDLEAVVQAAARLLAHDGMRKDADASEQVEMATRLSAFLVDAETKALAQPAESPLAEVVRLAGFQAEVGGYIDYARHVVDVEWSIALRKDLMNLVVAVDRIRDDMDARFAAAYARSVGATGVRSSLRNAVKLAGRTRHVLPIENVLAEMGLDVLTQLDDMSLLVLCMDGMSWANVAELWESIAKSSFEAVSKGVRPAVVAHLPTLTKLSRSALFAGRALVAGDKLDTARDGERLSNHEMVRALREKPVTLLRGDIVGEGGGLSSNANTEVRGNARIVAVVVNAIDDQLKGSFQVRINWKKDRIPALQSLLEAAAHRGRLVLLVSDHGHVLSRRFVGAAVRTGKDPEGMERGARHRVLRTGESAAADEIELPGGALGGRVAMAAHESIRYTQMLHAGEHGGATLAEAIAPAILLVPRGKTEMLESLGYRECPVVPPRCWDWKAPRLSEDMAQAEMPGAALAPAISKAGQASLPFEQPAVVEPPPALYKALVKTKFFQVQLEQLAEQHREKCRKAIELLIRRGGRMAQDPFAVEMGIDAGGSGSRVPGFVQRLEQVLNIDSEPVVEYQATTRQVVLNQELLRTIFVEDGYG
ncbi:MAG TPA: BREX-2 system phosphatase PglZ, partial [Polyangium sp.]|nr:BREX-2 system phosphatase PglZ [Polyangium sp.]